MSDEKFQNQYRIKSARATWHDYGDGAYFVTINTKDRKHYFGEIENALMNLSEIGKYATENLQKINDHYLYAEIPLFVVMPNHVHAIVLIDRHCRDVAPNVSTETDDTRCKDVARNVSTETTKNEKMVEIAKHQSLLCVTMRGFKSAVTKFANENGIHFAWQTRFHDHIIRNQDEMNRIADYIQNNPATWDTDCFNEKNNKK